MILLGWSFVVIVLLVRKWEERGTRLVGKESLAISCYNIWFFTKTDSNSNCPIPCGNFYKTTNSLSQLLTSSSLSLVKLPFFVAKIKGKPDFRLWIPLYLWNNKAVICLGHSDKAALWAVGFLFHLHFLYFFFWYLLISMLTFLYLFFVFRYLTWIRYIMKLYG